jgi:DNA-directed RNA polymerase specialized sigma24 family protein
MKKPHLEVPVDPLSPPLSNLPAHEPNHDAVIDLIDLLKALPPPHRLALVDVLESMTATESARHLEVSERTVKRLRKEAYERIVARNRSPS